MGNRARFVPDDTPVILLHGLFMTRAFWHPDNYAPLAQIWPVYALSLPGHFPEPPLKRPEDVCPESILASLDKQLDEVVGQQPVVLVGHSTGGLLSLFYAAMRPERVLRVVSVGGAPDGREEAFTYRLFQYVAEHWGWLGRAIVPPTLAFSTLAEPVHRYFLREAFAEPGRSLSRPEVRGYIRHYLPEVRKLDGASVSLMLDQLQYFDASRALGRMSTPALIISGDQDCYVSRDRTYHLGDLIPGSVVQIFADCGHMCMWEKPEAFYRVISNFIRTPAARRAAPDKKRPGSRSVLSTD